MGPKGLGCVFDDSPGVVATTATQAAADDDNDNVDIGDDDGFNADACGVGAVWVCSCLWN